MQHSVCDTLASSTYVASPSFRRMTRRKSSSTSSPVFVPLPAALEYCDNHDALSPALAMLVAHTAPTKEANATSVFRSAADGSTWCETGLGLSPASLRMYLTNTFPFLHGHPRDFFKIDSDCHIPRQVQRPMSHMLECLSPLFAQSSSVPVVTDQAFASCRHLLSTATVAAQGLLPYNRKQLYACI